MSKVLGQFSKCDFVRLLILEAYEQVQIQIHFTWKVHLLTLFWKHHTVSVWIKMNRYMTIYTNASILNWLVLNFNWQFKTYFYNEKFIVIKNWMHDWIALEFKVHEFLLKCDRNNTGYWNFSSKVAVFICSNCMIDSENCMTISSGLFNQIEILSLHL